MYRKSRETVSSKGQQHKIFSLRFFHESTHYGPISHNLNFFFKLVPQLPRYSKLKVVRWCLIPTEIYLEGSAVISRYEPDPAEFIQRGLIPHEISSERSVTLQKSVDLGVSQFVCAHHILRISSMSVSVSMNIKINMFIIMNMDRILDT